MPYPDLDWGPEPPDNPYRKLKIIQAEGGRKPIPPFEPGDVVQIIPHKGCTLPAEVCRVDLVIERCERAPVEPEIAWCIDMFHCPYLIIYPLPDGEDYTIVPVRLLRDQKI